MLKTWYLILTIGGKNGLFKNFNYDDVKKKNNKKTVTSAYSIKDISK